VVCMEEQQDQPATLEQFKKFSKSDFEEKTSREIRDLVQGVEKHLIDEVGKFDWDKFFEEDAELADRLHIAQDVLRKRMKAASEWKVEEDHDKAIDDHEERLQGMQTAIDKLKEHGHDGEIGTFKVTYPGRRD